jgi:MFS transporter, FHS family, L-fucose permease
MRNYRRPLAFVTTLFFMFGFLTCLNDILIPHLKRLFTLNYTQAMLVQVCFFSAYFAVSIPAGRITNKKGYRFGIVSGLALAAVGTMGFIPAAQFASYPLFLLSLFVLAAGITLLQVAVNPYVTLLGAPETSAFRLNLVQAFNSLGTTLAPLLGSILILGSANQVLAIQIPYLALTLILFLVALVFAKLPLPTLSEYSNEDLPSGDDSFKAYAEALGRHPHLILGMLAIFCYVGAEVSIGSFLVSWLGDKNVAGFEEAQAGRYVALYWGGAMVGRFFGSYLTAKFNPVRVLQVSLLSALILIAAAVFLYRPGFSMWAIIAIGLFNSIQFPTIFSLSVSRLGKDTPYASGLLCTCIVGGALIPLLQGIMADSWALRWSFIIPLVCYGYILAVAPRLEKKPNL